MANALHSQGFGFGSFVQGGVDPRTGQYTSTVGVYEVPAEARNCPPLKLSINYSSLNPQDIGLGKGWSFNLSSYQHREPSSNKTLFLSTGEHFQVTETASVLSVNDQKLKSFQFKKDGKGNYQVALKSGQVEILSNANNIYNTTVPIKLYAANGRSLDLTWTRFGERPRLSEIHDGSQCLLEIKYSDASVDIIRAPGTSEASTLTVVLRNKRLVELRLPPEEDVQPSWKFIYETFGQIICLSSVESPIGLVENVRYNPNGHRLPEGAPYKTIPYVISHVVKPGSEQPPIKTNYAFSDRNFLAYNAGYNWKEGVDNLYQAREDYQYTATVMIERGPRLKCTYNKFHLIVSTEQQKGTKRVTQAITYHSLKNGAFKDQPAQYQLPKTAQTIYLDTSSGASRTETTQYDFDEWGNPIRDILPSGIVTTRVYYAASEEKDKDTGKVLCPADPHGFQRYLKAEEVTPATTSYEAPIRNMQYTYHKLFTAAGAPMDYFVAARQSELLQDNQSIYRVVYTYVNQPAVRDHGRLQQQVTSLSGQVSAESSWTYEYPANFELFTEIVQKTAHDGYAVNDESTYSLSSGLVIAHKNPTGAQTCFRYDTLGRLVKSTASPDTLYEAVRWHKYAFLQGTAGQCTTVTDTKRMQTRYITDGLGRMRRVEGQDDDGEWAEGKPYNGTFRLVRERSYDALGQVVEVAEIDWLRTDREVTAQRRSQRFEYDDWGKVCRAVDSSGLVISSITTPIALTHTVGIEGEGKTETQFNLFGVPTQRRLVMKDGTACSEIKFAYDGLGRLVKEEDGLGHSKEYHFDCFDRVVETILPDDRKTSLKYVTQSAASLPISMSMKNGLILAEQSFDGLGRVKQITHGGRTATQWFEGTEPRPRQITPQGDQQDMTYESALEYSLKTLISGDTNCYQHDYQTTAVLRSMNENTAEDSHYFPSGLLERQSIQFQGEGALFTKSTYSMAGKLQCYTDVHGQNHEVRYDEFGRPNQLLQGKLRMTLTYDKANRLYERYARNEGETVDLITRLSYDDFGREIESTVHRGESMIYRLTQTYGKTSLVATRDVVDGDGALLRRESFQYDSQSHLVDYSCEGSQPPIDEKGHKLRSQHFVLDNYDNIVVSSTKFQDGSINAVQYSYSSEDPTQLARITNTHPDYPSQINLVYDRNGCLTQDEKGQVLEYDGMNRLHTIRNADCQIVCQYDYDANGKLVCQKTPGKPDRRLYYQGDILIAETEGDRKTSYAFDGRAYWGQSQQQRDGQARVQLWASDNHSSILASLDDQKPQEIQRHQYTPHGYSVGRCPIGFNGQCRDPVTGWYHLGNGYRVYNPALMRFHSPDGLSPFTSGEINPYAYCLGDPINRIDPSGHFSIFGIKFTLRDVAIMGVGLAVGIAAGVLTGGAGFAIAAGVVIAAGVASDVIVGITYDLASGKSPTWESVETDALTGLIGGVLGEGIGRVLAVGVKAAARGIGKTLGRRATQAIIAGEKYLMHDMPSLGRDITGRYYNTSQTIAIFDRVNNTLGHEGFLTHGTSDGYLMVKVAPGFLNFETTSDAAVRIQRSLFKSGRINRALRNIPLVDREFTLFACYAAESGAGQAAADVLNRDVRCFYGKLPKLPLNIGLAIRMLEGDNGIRNLYGNIRSTIRRPRIMSLDGPMWPMEIS